jgi:hypothetical protein
MARQKQATPVKRMPSSEVVHDGGVRDRWRQQEPAATERAPPVSLYEQGYESGPTSNQDARQQQRQQQLRLRPQPQQQLQARQQPRRHNPPGLLELAFCMAGIYGSL